MKCPHCAHEFPLTWKGYFQTPMPWGKHTCPACGQVSCFRNETAPAILALLVGVGAMAPYLWFLRNVPWDHACPRDWAVLAVAGLSGTFMGVMTDNYVKSRIRKLEKCGSPKAK